MRGALRQFGQTRSPTFCSTGPSREICDTTISFHFGHPLFDGAQPFFEFARCQGPQVDAGELRQRMRGVNASLGVRAFQQVFKREQRRPERAP